MTRPTATEYAPHFEQYVALVPEDDILAAMETQGARTLALLRGISEAQGNQRHPPYTWSIKEVVGHLTDAERIFGYRALRFARGDATPLPGFEENDYVRAAQFDRVALEDLVSQFEAVRQGSFSFFRTLKETEWTRSGVASDNRMTVRAIAYNIVGHDRHHTAILRRRLSC